MKKEIVIIVLGLSTLTLNTSANAASSVGLYKIFNSIKLFIFGEKALKYFLEFPVHLFIGIVLVNE